MAVRFWRDSGLALSGFAAVVAMPVPAEAAADHAPDVARGRPVALTTKSGDAFILSAPSTASGVTIRYILTAAGSRVRVTCRLKGEAVDLDTTWYRAVAPRRGYIAQTHLNVTAEQAADIPPCTRSGGTGVDGGGDLAGADPCAAHGGLGHRHHGRI